MAQKSFKVVCIEYRNIRYSYLINWYASNTFKYNDDEHKHEMNNSLVFQLAKM